MLIKKTMLYEPSKRAENVAKCSPCLHTVCPKKGYSSTSLYAKEDPSFSRVLTEVRNQVVQVGTYSRSLLAEVILNLPVRQKFNKYVFNDIT